LPTTADARRHLTAARRAEGVKDWNTALTEYSASMTAAPSGVAQFGMAQAKYELKDDPAAYEDYEAFLTTYGDSLGPRARAEAEARLQELWGRTGAMVIRVSENGAVVSIDDRPIGTSPVGTPIRVGIGAHKVRVTKPRFAPFEVVREVTGGARVAVDVTLNK
jgi:hypothetical protein